MLPPEIVALFHDWPLGLLLIYLASPFLIFIGVVVTILYNRAKDRAVQKNESESVKIARKNSDISETEAETHQFQAIIDGFKSSLEVFKERAESAERKADSAQQKANSVQEKLEELAPRVDSLENQRDDAIDHIGILESLIPVPPGPPPRPTWMEKHS